MVHGVKKQVWLTKDEDERLQKLSKKCCVTESEYIRMLLRGYVPKEKPDAEFYEVMRQLNGFSEQLRNFVFQFRECKCDMDILQDEIHRWHQFQLAIEERFLAPEKVSWL